MKKLLFTLLLVLIGGAVFGQSSPQSVPAYVKSRQWKNIKDFGAKGDGTTNDLTAIQAAVDALPDTGGVVFVPFTSVGYLINAPIVLPSNVSLVGEGKGSRIKLDASATRTMITNLDSVGGNVGIVIEGLYLDGGKSYASYTEPDSADCILLKNVSKSIVKNNWITNTDKDGIALRTGSVDNEITGNILWGLGEDGITVSGAATRRNRIINNSVTGRDTTYKDGSNQIPSGILCKASETVISGNIIRYGGAAIDINREDVSDTLRQVIVSNNIFVECNRTTVSVADGYDIKIEGNTFKDCRQRGVFTWASSPTSHDIQINGNSFWNQTSTAIFASSGNHYVISGNLIYSADSSGIVVAGDNAVVSSNRVNNCGQYGLWLQSSRYSSVTGNIVNGVGEHGIYLEGASGGEYVTISGNVVQKSIKNGIYLLSHDYCAVTGNQCIDNDSLASTTYSGIYLSSSNNNTIADNVCTSPNAKQDYGIEFSSSAQNIVHSNYLGGNVTGAMTGQSSNDLSYANKLNDSTTMRFYTQNRIGIGKTDPAGHIHIKQLIPTLILESDSTTAAIQFRDSGNSVWSVQYQPEDSSLVLRRTGVGDALKIQKSGKIVVGDSSRGWWYSLPMAAPTNGQVIAFNTTPTPDSGYFTSAGASGLDSTTAEGYFINQYGDTLYGHLIFDTLGGPWIRGVSSIFLSGNVTYPVITTDAANNGTGTYPLRLQYRSTGGVGFYAGTTERQRAIYDSISGLGRSDLTAFIRGYIDSLIADRLYAVTAAVDTLTGRDTGVPTMGDPLDMNDYSIWNIDTATGDVANFTEYLNIVADSSWAFNVTTSATGTEYITTSKRIKARPGANVVFSREDSTTFNLFRVTVPDDSIWAVVEDSLDNVQYVYLEFNPESWDRPLADSIFVLGRHRIFKDSDSSRAMLCLDSCSAISEPKSDTLYFSVAMPYAGSIDTVGLVMDCSGTGESYFTSYSLIGPDRENGLNGCDSIYQTWTDDLDYAVFTYVPLDNTDKTVQKGDIWGMRLIVNHTADNESVRIGWIRFAYRRIS